MKKSRLQELAGIHLKESSYTQVTKDVWSKMSDDEQADALLSAVKDPDEAESFIGSKWEDLPPQVSSNMHVYKGGLSEAAVEGSDVLVLTLKVPVEMFRDAAEAMEFSLDPDLEASPTLLKQLAATMEDDLYTWFQGNGGEWIEEGISENVYDDLPTLNF